MNWRKVKRFWPLILELGALLGVGFLFCGADQGGEEKRVSIVVKSLGIGDSSQIYERLEELEKNPTESVRLLISELSPIHNVVRIPPEEAHRFHKALHVVWCIRALRYLTGQTFSGATSYRFVGRNNVRQSVLQAEDGGVSFFGVRMAHDVIYLAPLDAQLEIIHKWKRWFGENARIIRFEGRRDFNEWYF
jgi:hypothetical protein